MQKNIKVIFFSNLQRQIKCHNYKQSEVLLLSLKKGVAKTALPSKLTAYMLSAKPIIASVDEDSGTADIIKSNKCGWVVEAENEIKLIECMKNPEN